MYRYAITSERRAALATSPIPSSADALFNLLIKFLHGKTLPIVFTNNTGYSLMGASRADNSLDMQLAQIEPGVEMTIELPPSITYYTLETLPSSVVLPEALSKDERYNDVLRGGRYLFVLVTLSVAFSNIDRALYYEPYQYVLKIEQDVLHRMRLSRRITPVAATIIASQQRSENDMLCAVSYIETLSHVPVTSVEYQTALQNTRPLGVLVPASRQRLSPIPSLSSAFSTIVSNKKRIY